MRRLVAAILLAGLVTAFFACDVDRTEAREQIRGLVSADEKIHDASIDWIWDHPSAVAEWAPELAADPVPQVRAGVAEALSWIGAYDAPELLRLLEDESDEVVQAAAGALRRSVPPSSPSASVLVTTALDGTADIHTRRACAYALADVPEAHREDVLRAIGSDDAADREIGIQLAIAETEWDGATTDALRQVLLEGEREDAQRLAWALGWKPDRGKAFVTVLADRAVAALGDQDCCRACVGALRAIVVDAEVIDRQLTELAGSPDPNVRGWVAGIRQRSSAGR